MRTLVNVTVTMLLFFGLCRAAQADATLWAGPVSAPTGKITCQALNVGKKALDVTVTILNSSGFHNEFCYTVPNSTAQACSLTHTSPYNDRWCKITVEGGSKRSVRGSLTVEDSSGNTLVCLEAK
jgi:hypothetical protein